MVNGIYLRIWINICRNKGYISIHRYIFKIFYQRLIHRGQSPKRKDGLPHINVPHVVVLYLRSTILPTYRTTHYTKSTGTYKYLVVREKFVVQRSKCPVTPFAFVSQIRDWDSVDLVGQRINRIWNRWIQWCCTDIWYLQCPFHKYDTGTK